MLNVIARNSIGGLVLDTQATVLEQGIYRSQERTVDVATLRVPKHNVAQVARASLLEAFQQNLMDDELSTAVAEIAALLAERS